jgi:hypothetical protein
MIFIVLGMHKSGTTLLARALHESGIVMGQEFPAGVDYAKAKYEAKWVQEINDEILGVDRSELSLRVTPILLPPSGLSDLVRERMARGIEKAERQYGRWGFKDPRAVLTYQYWKEGLPDHRLVVVYRDPIEVWKRYSGFNRPWCFRLPFRTWCDYNKMILRHLDGAEPGQAICLNFDQLLTGVGEWGRFRNFVGADLVDVRDSNQSVNRCSELERLSFAYRLLSLLAGREVERTYRALEEVRAGQLDA